MTWGSWDNRGGNGMRVAINQSRTSVSSGSSSVKFTLKIYTQNKYSYSDNQQLVYTGAIGGSTSFHNGQGSGSKLRATKYYTYNYSDYGKAHSTRVKARVPYSYNGSTPSVTVTLKIPARPYAKPTAPTNFRSTSWTSTSVKLAWTHKGSSKAPYTSQSIDWDYLDSKGNRRGYKRLATISKTATSFTKTGISTDQKIYFRIRSNNKAGSSGWTYFDNGPYYANTPSAPSSVKSTVDLNRSNITTSWKRNNKNTGGEISHQVERQVNSTSGAWTVVKTGLSATATSWIDSNPNAGYNRYRVRAVMGPYGPGNYVMPSGYSTGNTISTIVPPLAPTQLAPNGKPADFTRDVTFKWRHNDGGDGSEQSHFTIEYSEDEGESWEELVVNRAKNASEYRIPADTLFNGTEYVWRVKTQGSTDKDFGPFSAVATVVGSSTPTVTIQEDAPPDPLEFSPLFVEWVFQQDEDEEQATWEATLLDESGDIIEALSGSGSTNDSDDDDDDEEGDPEDTDESVTFKSAMEDGKTYTVRVRGQASSGLWSDWDEVTFTVDLLPPAETTIEPLYDADTGSMVLAVTAQPGHFEDWNLAPNPSFEDTSGTVDVWNNYIKDPNGTSASLWTANKPNDADIEVVGNGEIKITATTATSNGVYPSGAAPAGLLLSGQMVIRGEGSSIGKAIRLVAYSSGIMSNSITATLSAEPQTITLGSNGGLSAAGLSTIICYFADYPDRAGLGDSFYLSKPILSEVNQLNEELSFEFFTGDYSPDSDLTPVWTGTPGESASKLVGDKPSSVTPYTDIASVQSSREVESGKSLRIIHLVGSAFRASVGPSVYVFSSADYGKIFTVMATIEIPEGYDSADDRNSVSYSSRSAYLYGDSSQGVQAPEVPGTYHLRTTVVPVSGTSGLRLSGGGAIGQSVYWDNLAIVEGDYEGSYGGTFANAPVDSVDIQRRIDGGDWITILENLSMGHTEIYDEDFEDDPDDWVPNSIFDSYSNPTSWAVTTTKPFEGDHSLEVVWANPSGSRHQNVTHKFEDLTVGATYTVVMKVWSNTRFYTTWIFNTGDDYYEGTSDWQTVVRTFTATSESHFFVIANASPTAGKTTFVDNIMVVSGTVQGYLEDEDAETVTVLDVIPSTTELNEYRLRVSSIAPSTAMTEPVAADNSEQKIEQWLFLNYSEGFTSVLRFRQDPEVSVGVSRTQSTPSILGRRRPLLLQGKSTSYEVSVGGKLWYDSLCPIDPKDQDSHPKEWENAQKEAEIVCFRDNEGRRVFGALSDTDLATIITGHSSLGFKVTETFYEERPIELIQGVEV